MSTHIARRRFLAGSAVAFAAGAGAAVKMTAHPDADLLAAWEGLKKSWSAVEAMPMDTEQEDLDPYYDRQYHFSHLIETLPAMTPDGVAIKLKYLFRAYNEGRGAELAIMREATLNDELADYRDRMLWNLIANVQKMGA